MEWFFSDTHFSHDNIIRLCNRSFSSVGEMNSVIMGNIHANIRSSDVSYFLGDFSWDNSLGYNWWKEIPGKKFFIKGNHDYKLWDNINRDKHDLNTITVPGYLDTEIHRIPITMCHYPMLTWNKSHYGSILLYGHHHGNKEIQNKFPGKRTDVGVDAWNYTPISFDEVMDAMNKLPTNWDYLRHNK